jgi:Dynamin family
VSRNRFIRFGIAFIGTYIASLGGLWTLLEVYIQFTGDELKQILGAYWALVLYGSPILIALLVASLKAREPQRKSPRTSAESKGNAGILGENPDPLTMCRYLEGLVVKNASIIEQSTQRESYVNNLVQDLKDGTLRIYFFGHQNAGKSSLINALLGVDELSPTFPGKMTTCLVRIRWGATSRLVECYAGEVEDKKRDISRLKKRMEDWAKLHIEERPREVIIELPNNFLESNKIEVVDSPGTGSGWSVRYGSSLEDEIVNSEIKLGAIAVIVYRYMGAEFEAHERLMRYLGNNNIRTIAVCNLDPNWASELEQNKNNIQETIARAEKRLRDEAKAQCYRIAIKGTEHIQELARQENGTTIEELRTSLLELLSDRKVYVVQQAIRRGRDLINDLLQETGQYIRQHKPLFTQIEDERKSIFEAILGVREVLNKGYEPVNGAAWGSIFGTAAGIGLSLAAGSLLLPVLPGLAVLGAGVGGFMDMSQREDFKKRLADKWTRLQGVVTRSAKINSTGMISQEVIKKMRSSSSSLSEAQHKRILNELETELNANLQKVEGYEAYRKNQDLEDQLRELKKYF